MKTDINIKDVGKNQSIWVIQYRKNGLLYSITRGFAFKEDAQKYINNYLTKGDV